MIKLIRRLFGIHKCNFVIPETISGVKFLKCDQCNTYDTAPEQQAKDDAEMDGLMNKLKSFARPESVESQGSMWHPNETI